ncbi:outer membrane protein [Sorangium cellulosum]|uniref:Outer membrane protein n=1 Tax=Sorangium cellulosum TaxID=56 RepID=A0A4P2QAM9_SORCE|nr:outer membrane protein transport protein [Sorangium cellulosum]AUX26710.1 outer membrane protein [Sorangium cellulosum]
MSGALPTSRPRARARQQTGRELSLVALATGLACLTAAEARASGLDAPWITSGASGPTTPDAAAVYWNPAALADVKRPELLLGAGLIVGHATYARERRGTYQTPDTLQFKLPLDPANVDPGKTGRAEQVSATPIAPTGNGFLAIPAIPDRLTLGVGLYVPYAAALGFPEDGAQRWQLRQAFIVASSLTAAAGVKLNEKVSLGVGVSYVSGLAELSKVQDFAGLSEFRDGLAYLKQDNDFGPSTPSELRELDVLARSISIKQAISHGASFHVGLSFNPNDDLRFGLTYQHSAAMRYKGKFAIDMDHPFFTQDLAEQGLRYEPLVEGDAELSFTLPKRLTAGVGYRVSDRLSLDGLLSYVLYSDVEAFVVEASSPDLAQPKLGITDRVTVTLPRDWNDTVWLEVGAKYRLSDALLATASVGYQSPASPDSTIDVASPDNHRLIGDIGGVLRVSDSVSLSGDVRVQGILPRTVTESNHDLGNGTYSLVLATVGGHLKVVF